MHTDLPRTLQEAIIYFADPDNCHSFLVAIRWPNGVKCPHCGSSRITWLANQQRWKCRQDHASAVQCPRRHHLRGISPGARQVAGGGLDDVNAKNGISSYEVHRALGVTQKTAWFMGHRVLQPVRLNGCRPTFIGGKARNMHSDVKARRITAVRATRLPCLTCSTYHHRAAYAAAGSALYSDAMGCRATMPMKPSTTSRSVDGALVARTPWSLLKRGAVSVHLPRR